MNKKIGAYKTIGEVVKILGLKTKKSDNLKNKLVNISSLIKKLKNLK